jgi:ubiquinone/menaquinone biosynthesis C-methylase UbiE
MSGNDPIREANSNRYSDPSEVDGYLLEPYHALRSSIGINLLCKETRRLRKEVGKIQILELAASTGMVAKQIEDNIRSSVITSDIEYVPLTRARRVLSSDIGSNCIQLDAARSLPFAPNSFAGIYMGELIEHLFDTKSILSECCRVLVPNGILVVTTPNLAGLQDRIGFIFGKSPRHVNPLHDYLYLHIRPFTFGMIKSCLETTGFRVIAVKSNYIRIRFSSGRRIDSRMFARFFPTLGGSLIVAARKNVA